ncbi:toll/interleukin-1 receptor domain-containing protein [Nitrosomonas sp. Is37]|uniref:toll/interleukin-1 receptor domain-containing protein n=1 Tax=Nitrosomonas sp. Is37 TaxID=3080535 RepID=UPI00294AD29D|nr:toll/interleukin-1 receptor domain-containing protein [Nitrosomonas sp. Is37]MDV6345723.1 toll/interleukin-1 receptor domain-containing protein [Nitrosomonas sp. Is37]
MDVDDIRPGQDFVRAIDDTVAGCDYLLVLIGPRWVEMMERYSSATYDFVRHEIHAGLSRNITVIPVLVAGARMPEARQLPSDLAELSRRNAIEIRDDRFDDDVAKLIECLNIPSFTKTVKPTLRSHRRVFASAIAFVLAVVAGATLISLRPAATEINGKWVADMQKPGQRSYRISMTLSNAGNTIHGIVNYPTGGGPIQEGSFDGASLTFSTSHIT